MSDLGQRCVEVRGCLFSGWRTVRSAVGEKDDDNWNSVVMATLLLNHLPCFVQSQMRSCTSTSRNYISHVKQPHFTPILQSRFRVLQPLPQHFSFAPCYKQLRTVCNPATSTWKTALWTCLLGTERSRMQRKSMLMFYVPRKERFWWQNTATLWWNDRCHAVLNPTQQL